MYGKDSEIMFVNVEKGDFVDIEKIIAPDSRSYAWSLINRARHFMTKARLSELAPYEISDRQAIVMDILYNLGRKLTLTELAKYLDREVNTLSYQMIRMEKGGLVKKIRERPKSTLLKFELTKKGELAYKKSLKRESINKIMSVFSEEERQQLILMMQKLINAAEKCIEET